ncbi:hypothetical protein A2331_06255 [Candidatus Falkowbacteria bacterium RIFOXYB2_FULL_34_18]|uniref:Uncharacterized protein n=1 Tax=Candidatus Falkowbacteria bacterium RIFOXYD2_FULL_34_120 TaxID=1798007 RepID=A0A1F5TNN5_9BACT|nr:MAG: hypothetical protein A2331_06255 [Candidatus Falkowbacteria bacterium RIFOXYB2_FULL_34_18]OGF28765.1 MAG: hypothetical protein A2500_04445 [Candidatus Falkowbacteria bacterium RIFOXYC12_FULL_34_55]OGF35707.1 MAG: hypothetical protein A2466_05115 [Candidatus Falkowbacteria bacterium RIFOXYC2_FULL_34_220]OGF38423.1 MAG: hypothetical protein A2515_00610 [Candidatus Falkowbacteria bacterium RIFOXYD12_FULL_34_57]OGF40477.1 MAG: hypothetical protein A2531_03085 [Candidatus Falkowbacteria bact
MKNELKRIEIQSGNEEDAEKGVKIKIVDHIIVSPETEVSICVRGEKGQIKIINYCMGWPMN